MIKTRNYYSTFVLLLIAILFVNCSSELEQNSAHISGQITIDQEMQNPPDLEGLILLVALNDTQGVASDTLFYAKTDSSGKFSGSAIVNQRGIYPIIISDNEKSLAAINIVLAVGDSIQVDTELPNVEEKTVIRSKENDAYNTYQRLERNFNRVAYFIDQGLISEDSIGIELQKWSDQYWELFNTRKGTLASERAGAFSVSLLNNLNPDLMVARADTLLETTGYLNTNLRQLVLNYHAEKEGLDSVLSYLNRLEKRAEGQSQLSSIQRKRIEVLFDSAKTTEAESHLTTFKRAHKDNNRAMEWAENFEYELQLFSPGQPFPDFELELTNGDIINKESLEGSAFMIEFTRLDNPMYQAQYERTIAIYRIYNNFGLRIITVPFAATDVTVDAFFEERVQLWDMVKPNTFDANELAEFYNINYIPTRFLINDKGEIIRRYTGPEYDNIVQGLQKILTNQEI